MAAILCQPQWVACVDVWSADGPVLLLWLWQRPASVQESGLRMLSGNKFTWSWKNWMLCFQTSLTQTSTNPGWGNQKPGPRFNIKMSSYQYRKSHCGDKTILRPSYLHNGISYTSKTTFLYWIGVPVRMRGSQLGHTGHKKWAFYHIIFLIGIYIPV